MSSKRPRKGNQYRAAPARRSRNYRRSEENVAGGRPSRRHRNNYTYSARQSGELISGYHHHEAVEAKETKNGHAHNGSKQGKKAREEYETRHYRKNKREERRDRNYSHKYEEYGHSDKQRHSNNSHFRKENNEGKSKSKTHRSNGPDSQKTKKGSTNTSSSYGGATPTNAGSRTVRAVRLGLEDKHTQIQTLEAPSRLTGKAPAGAAKTPEEAKYANNPHFRPRPPSTRQPAPAVPISPPQPVRHIQPRKPPPRPVQPVPPKPNVASKVHSKPPIVSGAARTPNGSEYDIQIESVDKILEFTQNKASLLTPMMNLSALISGLNQYKRGIIALKDSAPHVNGVSNPPRPVRPPLKRPNQLPSKPPIPFGTPRTPFFGTLPSNASIQTLSPVVNGIKGPSPERSNGRIGPRSDGESSVTGTQLTILNSDDKASQMRSTEIFSIDNKPRIGAPLLGLHVRIPDTRESKCILVWEGDNIQKVADAFCDKYGMNEHKYSIQANLMKLLEHTKVPKRGY